MLRFARPPEDRATFARRGERAAERFLARRGYLTLQRNYAVRQGEIDLVMQDGETIVFVEVKARRSLHSGQPLEAVDRAKRRRMAAAARAWLATNRLAHRVARYDAVGVTYQGRRLARVEHVRDLRFD